eukprot:sb/3475915/
MYRETDILRGGEEGIPTSRESISSNYSAPLFGETSPRTQFLQKSLAFFTILCAYFTSVCSLINENHGLSGVSPHAQISRSPNCVARTRKQRSACWRARQLLTRLRQQPSSLELNFQLKGEN